MMEKRQHQLDAALRRDDPTAADKAARGLRFWRVKFRHRGGSPRQNRELGRQMAIHRGWPTVQFRCADRLFMRESRWHRTATNSSTGAFGIPQALPASKLRSAGSRITLAWTQIKWGYDYMEKRYGTACAALSHSNATSWY
jgi:hypothetical protein